LVPGDGKGLLRLWLLRLRLLKRLRHEPSPRLPNAAF
jgi:hypothetical protein